MRLADVLAMLLLNETRDEVLQQALVYQALARALLEGLPAGVNVEGRRWTDDPDHAVAYIDLPGGQVRFRLAPYRRGWDGHSRAERDARIAAYVALMAEQPPPLTGGGA